MKSQLKHETFSVDDKKIKGSIDGATFTDLGEKGIIVDFGKENKKSKKSKHDDNLIEEGNVDYQSLGISLLEAVQSDKSSRKEWEQNLIEGIKQMGIKSETNAENLAFSKASGVYSPAFMEAYLKSVASIQSELLPPSGPAKCCIVGDETEELLDRSERIEKWINVYLTQIDKEFYPDMEQAISWLVLYGSVFVKTYYDSILKRPKSKYIKPQDFIVNYNTSSLSNCTRITNVLYLTEKELKERQYANLYKKIEIEKYDNSEEDEVDKTVKSQDGQSPDESENEGNTLFKLYECHVDLDLEGYKHEDDDGNKTGLPLPYIVTLDAQTGIILAIYKNWVEGDPHYKRIEYFTNFSYVTGLGFYAYGLTHIAGVSSEAATSILRQLINTGMFANFPGGFRAAALKTEDPTLRISPGQWIPLDVSGIGSINDAFSPLPYNEPSLVLKELKNEIEQGITRVAAAAESQFADFNPNIPVGTTYALLEQANKLQSSIMHRLHRSMKDMFTLLYKLFGEYMDEKDYPYSVVGSKTKVIRTDFKPDLNIIPISDPNITSSAQRLIRWEAVRNYAKENPELFDIRALTKIILREMKVPEIDLIMTPEDEEPAPLDPITENRYILTGKPVKAYKFQDQDAYIASKMPFMIDQTLDPQVIQAFKANISERVAYKYEIQMEKAIGHELPEDPSKLDYNQQNKIAQAVAQASQELVQQIQQQQQEQPSPEAAAMVEAQAAMIEAQATLEEVKVREKEVEYRAEIDMKRLDLDERKAQLENDRLMAKDQSDQIKLDMDMAKLEMESENQSNKLAFEQMKIEQQGKNEELKAETSAYEAQLKYETEQDKIKAKKEEFLQKEIEQQIETDISNDDIV